MSRAAPLDHGQRQLAQALERRTQVHRAEILQLQADLRDAQLSAETEVRHALDAQALRHTVEERDREARAISDLNKLRAELEERAREGRGRALAAQREEMLQERGVILGMHAEAAAVKLQAAEDEGKHALETARADYQRELTLSLDLAKSSRAEATRVEIDEVLTEKAKEHKVLAHAASRSAAAAVAEALAKRDVEWQGAVERARADEKAAATAAAAEAAALAAERLREALDAKDEELWRALDAGLRDADDAAAAREEAATAAAQTTHERSLALALRVRDRAHEQELKSLESRLREELDYLARSDDPALEGPGVLPDDALQSPPRKKPPAPPESSPKSVTWSPKLFAEADDDDDGV